MDAFSGSGIEFGDGVLIWSDEDGDGEGDDEEGGVSAGGEEEAIQDAKSESSVARCENSRTSALFATIGGGSANNSGSGSASSSASTFASDEDEDEDSDEKGDLDEDVDGSRMSRFSGSSSTTTSGEIEWEGLVGRESIPCSVSLLLSEDSELVSEGSLIEGCERLLDMAF